MNYKDLFYFTGHCLSLDDHPEFRETIRSRAEANEIDWEAFVELCSEHLIIPVIYLKFRDHHILELLEDELVQELRKIYELNRERNLQILKQIDEICAVLHPENIYPVFLKGTANLLDGLYSDLGERMMCDIDFLVKEEEFYPAAELLESNGYFHLKLIPYIDYKIRKHYPCLIKTGAVAPVEIHRTVVSKRNSKLHQPELVFKCKKEVEGKPDFFVPSDEHKLIHTFLHSQFENYGHAYKTVYFRGFYDLYLFSKRMNVSKLATNKLYKRKAFSWLAFGEKLLQQHQKFNGIETFDSQIFTYKSELALSFSKTHSMYIGIKRYVLAVKNALVYQDERISALKRLKPSNW